MTDNTENLGLPYIAAAQAQKHITHNEAIRALDALVQLSVRDRDLTAPPGTKIAGDRYIVAAGGTGDWSGKDGQIAAFQDNGWLFYAPQKGWLCWVEDEDTLLSWNGTAWQQVSSDDGGDNGSTGPADLLGINTTADTTNRLSVSSPASLFNHEGAGHRIKVNKKTVADTASLLFQTGFSGRAEFGITGNDDFHVKTSADGSVWKEAMVADKTTGAVSFPNGIQHPVTAKPVAGLIFTPGGDGETTIFRNDTIRTQEPRQLAISSVSGDTITVSTNSAGLFYHPFMRNVSLVRIWNISKSPAQPAWIRHDPSTNQLQVTDGSHVSGWSGGDTLQLGDIAGAVDVPSGFTRGYAIDISPMMQARLGGVFRQSGLLLKVASFGVGVRVGLGVSADAIDGSFIGGNSLTDGAGNKAATQVPTTIKSPVSDSNLVFLREEGNGPDSLGVSILAVTGIYV